MFLSSQFQGRGFKRVEAHEIEVRVGPVSCPVSDVSDVDISCLFEIPADLGFHNEVIQVRGCFSVMLKECVFCPHRFF